MKTQATKLATIAVALLLTGAAMRPAAACEECQLRKQGTYLGQFTILGNGTARTWVKYGVNGKPMTIGITFSETALSGLPDAVPKGMMSVKHNLMLPDEAAVTGFDHIGLDWNPKGHQPNGIYDTPHFDIHFYMWPQEELNKITLKGADKARCDRQPESRFLPTGYIMPPGTQVPGMGAHAIDSAALELQGKPFTHTFIYGYYNGRVHFIEPMVTKAFLDTKTDVTVSLKSPAAYQKAGYYPSSYSIKFDELRKEYSVTLEGLTLRPSAPAKATKIAVKK